MEPKYVEIGNTILRVDYIAVVVFKEGSAIVRMANWDMSIKFEGAEALAVRNLFQRVQPEQQAAA